MEHQPGDEGGEDDTDKGGPDAECLAVVNVSA